MICRTETEWPNSCYGSIPHVSTLGTYNTLISMIYYTIIIFILCLCVIICVIMSMSIILCIILLCIIIIYCYEYYIIMSMSIILCLCVDMLRHSPFDLRAESKFALQNI